MGEQTSGPKWAAMSLVARCVVAAASRGHERKRQVFAKQSRVRVLTVFSNTWGRVFSKRSQALQGSSVLSNTLGCIWRRSKTRGGGAFPDDRNQS